MTISALVILQSGHAMATVLLDRVGIPTSAVLRLGFSAALLLILIKPRVSRFTPADWKLLLPFSVILAMQCIFLYSAIARIPLGIALAITFTGPLAVAVFRAGHRRDIALAMVAFVGVLLLLNPFGSSQTLDYIGVAFACGGSVTWGSYLLMSTRVLAQIPRLEGLSVGMALGAALVLPLALFSGSDQPLTANTLLLGFTTAILSTALPFSMEAMSMRMLPLGTFGILMSLEPAIAAAIGFLLLNQALPPLSIIGLVLIVCSSIAVTSRQLGVLTPAH